MQPAVPEWDFQFQAMVGSRASAVVKASFRALKPLLEPALTDELSRTLVALKCEIDLGTSRGQLSPKGFLPISWARWRGLLGRTSNNAIKTRLARLEGLGLIEILPSERGSAGTSLNCYRLRGVNESAATDTPLSDRATGTDTPLSAGSTATDTPLSARATGTDTPLSVGSRATDTPLSGGSTATDTPLSAASTATDTPLTGISNFYINTDLSTSVPIRYIKKANIELNRLNVFERNKMKEEKFQSINQSLSISSSININGQLNDPSIDGLIDRTSDFNSGLKAFLRVTDPQPWPQLLRQGLSEILDPGTVPVIEERSPWSAKGAWAILEAIRIKGRNLGNRAGTLWNALLQFEKGAGWLARSGSCSTQAGWRKASGDGLAREGWVSSGGICDQVRTEALASGNEARAKRPEELSPQVKAQLRTLIEDFRQAFRTSLQGSASEKKDAIDAFAKTFQHAVEALEPWLPLQVTLLDEYRPTKIRDRHQIKTNVLGAIYRALS